MIKNLTRVIGIIALASVYPAAADLPTTPAYSMQFKVAPGEIGRVVRFLATFAAQSGYKECFSRSVVDTKTETPANCSNVGNRGIFINIDPETPDVIAVWLYNKYEQDGSAGMKRTRSMVHQMVAAVRDERLVLQSCGKRYGGCLP